MSLRACNKAEVNAACMPVRDWKSAAQSTCISAVNPVRWLDVHTQR